jgi:hypothetical protein
LYRIETPPVNSAKSCGARDLWIGSKRQQIPRGRERFGRRAGNDDLIDLGPFAA